MTSKKFKTFLLGGWIFVLILIGLGFFFSDTPVVKMCSRNCWLNELLHLLLGDRLAKILIGSIILMIAAGFIGLRRKISGKKDDR